MKGYGMKKIPIVFWDEHKVQSPVPVRIRVLDRARWRFGLGRMLRAVCLLLTAFRLG
jgi:hypothetical protein